MLITTQKVSTHAKFTEYRDGNLNQERELYNSSYAGFTKPDKPVVNPKVNGFRRPSNYSCPATFGSLTPSMTARGPSAKVSIDLDYTIGRWRRMYSGDENLHYQLRQSFFPPHLPVDPLRNKLLNNVRAEVFDVAMVLAEMQGTASLLGNGLVRLGHSMDLVRKRRPMEAYYLMFGRRNDGKRPTDRFLRDASSVFLEWKYGVTPTLMDISGAAKALDMNEKGSLWDNPPLLVARAVNRDVITEDRTFVVSSIYNNQNFDLPVRFERTAKARLDYRVSGEGLRGLNRYGLGLGTVATLLFERTPFSFVLNMAFPLAELIKAWTALAGVDVVGYCETLHQNAQVQWPDHLDRSGGGHRWTGLVNGSEEKIPHWHRSAYSSVPMPMPYVRNPIKVSNISTALALFTTLRNPSGYK